MGPAANRRQYARLALDVAAPARIADASGQQVAPLVGNALSARIADISAGGARLITSTFIPRGTLIDLDVPATDKISGGLVRGRVMSCTMSDREPHYSLGLSFEERTNDLVQQLERVCGEMEEVAPRRARKPPEKADGELGIDGAPDWMALLQRVGLVRAQVLQTAWRESARDAERAGEWLLNNGCISQRDLALVRAESLGIPFVDPGQFRIDLENRLLISEETARSLGVFPLFALERVITLAAAGPLELTALDQIRLHTGCEVDVCLAVRRELQNLIDWAYGQFEDGPRRQSDSELVWADVLEDVADAPAVKLVNVLLDQAAAGRASDIHLDPEEQSLRARFRIDGVLREVPAPPKSLLPSIVSRLKILGRMDISETRRPQDGHFKFAADREQLDIRVSTLPSTDGEAVVLRLLRSGGRLLSLEELGLPVGCRDAFDRLIHLPHGMLLVTGPTGSGKTTTMYAALARLDRVRQSIVTLEDPVEIRLPQIRQVSVNPKAGLTFGTGLRAILRQDPDCIMVGEIRDRETAEIGLQAALTGHLMLSTLHTNSAAGATARLLDMGAPDFLVASALVGVLAQRLCRRLCSHCARPATSLPPGIAPPVAALLRGGKTMEAVGCQRCGHTGYEGRIGIFELLTVTDESRRAILAREDERAVLAIARRSGMRVLVEDGVDKVRRGLTTVEELLRVTGRIEHGLPDGATAEHSASADADPQAEFDVTGYERLLRRWLQPSEPALAAGAAGGR